MRRRELDPRRPVTAPVWPVALAVLVLSVGGTAAILWAAVGVAHVIAAHEGPALALLAGACWLGWKFRPRPRKRRGGR